jgi:hypothetical protein
MFSEAQVLIWQTHMSMNLSAGNYMQSLLKNEKVLMELSYTNSR